MWIYLFTDQCLTVQLHNQLSSSLAVKEKKHGKRGGEWQSERNEGCVCGGGVRRAKDCGHVSRGKPQVGSGVARLICPFPLCDWVSHYEPGSETRARLNALLCLEKHRNHLAIKATVSPQKNFWNERRLDLQKPTTNYFEKQAGETWPWKIVNCSWK